MYCHRCGNFIDTDNDAEHFGESGTDCELYPEDECETTMAATDSNGGSAGENER